MDHMRPRCLSTLSVQDHARVVSQADLIPHGLPQAKQDTHPGIDLELITEYLAAIRLAQIKKINRRDDPICGQPVPRELQGPHEPPHTPHPCGFLQPGNGLAHSVR